MNGWVKKNLMAVITILILVIGLAGQAAYLRNDMDHMKKSVEKISVDVAANKAALGTIGNDVAKIQGAIGWVFKEAE